MTVANETKTDWIEIEAINEDELYPSSVETVIHIKTKRLDCYFVGIWLEIESIEHFIAQLQTLDEQRKGTAKMLSIFSESFSLEILAIDGWGHLATRIRIEKANYSANGYQDTEILQTGFEIDPSSLPAVIKGLKELKDKNNY